MVLRIKLCYCSEKYETSIYDGKKHGRLPKTKKLWFTMEKTMEIYQKYFKFFNKFLALELGFTMENLWC